MNHALETLRDEVFARNPGEERSNSGTYEDHEALVRNARPRTAETRRGYDMLADFPGQDRTRVTAVVRYATGDPLAADRVPGLVELSRKIAAIPDVSYVVIVSGSFDLLMEVVCEDDDHLLSILNDKVRAIPGIRSTETFTYLRLDKQTFAWGTR